MEVTKSYAEALKSKISTSSHHAFIRTTPQRPSYSELTQIVIPNDEPEWTDVSSISSCSWPESTLEEILADSIASLPTRHPVTVQPTMMEDHCPEDDFSMIDDFPQDTRGHHRAAGTIKSEKRSKRLYTTVDFPHCDKRLVWAVHGVNPKPWKPFPGCGGCAHSHTPPKHVYRRDIRLSKVVQDTGGF